MTNLIIDLELLNNYLLPDLGTVKLIPGLTLGNTEPSSLPTTVSVMSSFALVMKKKYRFSYNIFRFLQFGYILERDGKFESGEFQVISKAVYIENLNPSSYTIPDLFVSQLVKVTDSSIGVDLGVMTDNTTTGVDPQFGISFKITKANPTTVFPTLRMFLIKALPTFERES